MVNSNKKKRKNNRKKSKVKQVIQTDQDALIPVNNDESEEQHTSIDDELDQQASKRNNTDDSDVEDEPKRKKKKKQPLPAETGKGAKSIRQVKREKHAQRLAEVQAASKDQLKSQCISYLSEWKHNRQNWKFMKVKQVWLYKNKFSSYQLPDSSWPTLLEYFESAKGNIRTLLLEDANKVITQMDEWTESQNSENNAIKSTNEQGDNDDEKEGSKKPDDTAYKRARDLIQCLQE